MEVNADIVWSEKGYFFRITIVGVQLKSSHYKRPSACKKALKKLCDSLNLTYREED